MASQIVSNAKLFFGGYDMSGDISALALKYGAAAKESTTLASAGFREYKPGLKDVTFQHEGFWNGGAGNVDDTLFGEIAVVDVPMSICPLTGAEGDVAFTFKAIEAAYAPGAKIGDMLAFSVSGQGDGDLVRGTLVHNSAETAGGNGNIFNLGAVLATQKLHASLHLLDVAGGGPIQFNCKIQSDAVVGFGTPTDRITFAQMAAVGAQWAAPVAGAITDAYWRLVFTLSGITSATFAVVIGIQ